MKKVLFATTALIATAGVASADVTLSGSAQMGLIYREAAPGSNVNTTVAQHEINLNVAMSGTTDNGLSFGGSFSIAGDTAAGNEDSVVYVSGEFGKISVGGNAADANEVLGIADLGFDGMNIDDVVEDLGEQGVDSDLNWTYTVNGLTIGVSADVADTGATAQTTTNTTTPMGVGVKYAAGNGLTLAAGYVSVDNAADDDAYSLGVTYTSGAMTINAGIAEQTDSNVSTRGTGLSIAYAVDTANTITFVATDRDTAGWQASYGVGLTTNLGGGATFNAAVSSVDDGMFSRTDGRVNQAQVGISMAF